MKRIDNYNHTYNMRVGISVLISVTVILVVVMIGVPTDINKLMDIVRGEAIVTLQNVSSQNIMIIKNSLYEKQKTFFSLAKHIEYEKKYDINEILNELEIYVKAESFYNMGIIDKNGICYTSLGEIFDLSGNDYFIEGMKGVSTITDSQLSEDKKELLIIFTIPIYKDGKVEMLITISYKSSDFSKLFNITSFNGFGHSICIDSEGKLITCDIDSEGLNLEEEYYENRHREEIAKLVAEMIENKEEQVTKFEYNGKSYLAYYEPIGINDWNLLSYAPKEYLYTNINIIKSSLFRGSVAICIVYFIFLAIFISEQIKYKKRMTQLVFFDELTKEKNYEYLKLYFNNMIEREKREKSLVIMDIDKFNSINIIYGSQMGDRLLKYIVSIFKELLPHDELFRCQADVFVIIVNSTSREEVINKINKIENRISEDVDKGVIVPISLCVGVCSLNEFSDFHSIYNNSLIAKNLVKGSINRNINFFDEKDKNRLIENREIELGFLDALKNNEFEVWYQPKYNAKTEDIYGAEALVRWRRQDNNFILPSKFIPVLEKTGQIIKLDEAVIEKVFKDIQEMKQLDFDIKPISINLSRVQVTNYGLINRITELVEEYQINPSTISFEITESVVVDDSRSINNLISHLHEMGFKVDIDDYGIGNSTLNGIFGSNFDTLKLDKTFADNIGDPKMDAIIHSTIEMARTLNMTVIAEGVESREQVEFLIENNCSIIQGYYYSKPLVKEEYFKLQKKKKI